MSKIVLLSLFLYITTVLAGQTRVEGTAYSHFQIELKSDTIDFVIADTSFILKKPLLLFCQGSLPVPLFIDFGNNDIWPVSLSNFDLNKMKQHYHVAVIAMPKTPLIVGRKNLNKSMSYVTDTSNQYSYADAYLKADYSDNYTQRANKVIKFLLKQSWIAGDEVVVAGHSQGAHIAVNLASTNKKVSQVGLFGYNPFGRIDQFIRQARKDAEAGRITWGQADKRTQMMYSGYKQKDDADFIANAPLMSDRLQSFSKPQLSELVEFKIPIYVGYGSEDIIADLCDLLPLYFIDQGKENYVVKRYPNLEHNFFPVADDGSVNHSNGKWKKVMNAFIDWTLVSGLN